MRLPRYARSATAVQSLRKVDPGTVRPGRSAGAARAEASGLGRPGAMIPDECVEPDADPDDVERRGWQGAVQPAVDDKAGGADDVHALIEARAPGAPAAREQRIRDEDERGAHPADDFHCELQSTTPTRTHTRVHSWTYDGATTNDTPARGRNA